MKQFIANAAPVLKKISHNGEMHNLLKDQTWVLVDGKDDDERYIFHDNGEVIIEKNHNKITVKWDFSHETNKLHIHKTEPVVYFIDYIDKAVIVLQKDIHTEKFQYFANIKQISDLNIEQYLHNVIAKHLHLSLVHVTAGFDMEIHRRHAEDSIGSSGQEVTCNLEAIADGFYQSSTSNFIYEVRDSKIVHKKHVHKLTLSDGTQTSLYSENKTPFVSVGDNLVVNLKPLENGKYTTEEEWFIFNEGKVSKTGNLKKFKTGDGTIVIEQNDSKPMPGDEAYYEGGKPFNGEVSIGLFKKVKAVNGKIV